MRAGNDAQVHVDDLAPLEVLVIEVADDELAAGDVGQELLLGDLGVPPMALDEVLLLLLVVVLEFDHPALAEVPHHLLLLVVQLLIVLILVVLVVLVEERTLVVGVVQGPRLLVLQLLLHLGRLVTNGLIHNHVRKDLRSHLLHSAWCRSLCVHSSFILTVYLNYFPTCLALLNIFEFLLNTPLNFIYLSFVIKKTRKINGSILIHKNSLADNNG